MTELHCLISAHACWPPIVSSRRLRPLKTVSSAEENGFVGMWPKKSVHALVMGVLGGLQTQFLWP
jgi:hypothetical protein